MPEESQDGIEIRIVIVVLVILFFLLIGAVVFQNLENLSFVDSIYLSTSTLTTVGYGDIHPTRDESKLFAVGFMLLGISITFYALWIIASYVFNKQEPKIEKRIMDAIHLIHKNKTPTIVVKNIKGRPAEVTVKNAKKK